jgi:hypothetical protein
VSNAGNPLPILRTSPWNVATEHWRKNRALILIRLGMALAELFVQLGDPAAGGDVLIGSLSRRLLGEVL